MKCDREAYRRVRPRVVAFADAIDSAIRKDQRKKKGSWFSSLFSLFSINIGGNANIGSNLINSPQTVSPSSSSSPGFLPSTSLSPTTAHVSEPSPQTSQTANPLTRAVPDAQATTEVASTNQIPVTDTDSNSSLPFIPQPDDQRAALPESVSAAEPSASGLWIQSTSSDDDRPLTPDELKDLESYPFLRTMVTRSRCMLHIFEELKHHCNSDTTILIQGESGAGKDTLARAIHSSSLRRDKEFVPVNCSSLGPESLQDSTLFGYEEKSFTGAGERRQGLIESAEGKTIFLNEIAELQPVAQAKLLDILEGKSFTRVGGTSPVKVNVRFLAATNANLAERVQEGKFRKDLYFRIARVSVRIPSLRERRRDVPLLVAYFLQKNHDTELSPSQIYDMLQSEPVLPDITPNALEMFKAHQWSGNVRELEDAIKAAKARAGKCPVDVHHVRFVASIERSSPKDQHCADPRVQAVIEILLTIPLYTPNGKNTNRLRIACKKVGYKESTMRDLFTKQGLKPNSFHPGRFATPN